MSQMNNVPPKLRPQVKGGRIARAALYARVSTEEQTKKNYPSCESQIELLQQHAQKNGWQVVAELQDAGYSAGSLKRPQLSRLRQMVADGDIDVIVATYYDRLTRSRAFFQLDEEFKENDVRLETVFDKTNTGTAAGRFMEMMLVAAKTYEREQTGEKVANKARMRSEKVFLQAGMCHLAFTRPRKPDWFCLTWEKPIK